MAGSQNSPAPTAMPSAAVAQMDVAVVRPETVRLSLKITPAPRKPMPVMMLDAIRSGVPPAPSRSDRIVKTAEPRQMSAIVRSPAALLLYVRSAPTAAPTRTATTKRARSDWMSGPGPTAASLLG